MAPALPLAPREPLVYNPDALQETEPLSHHRRALASVDNLATHMEEDDMGLQTQPSLAKDSQEMEQILVDLGSSDLAQADLLQAIKTLESGGDVLSTGDADAIFPGFDLPETVDSEGDAGEDKIKIVQVRLERRCAFLQRRLRILQARAMGKRISEEVALTFERSTRGARKDGGGRPVGLKAFLKRIETTAALQASAASRNVAGPKYYHASTSKGDASKSASIGIASGTLTGLEETAGALKSHLSVVKHELDSDATASSSGAESNDEAVAYNNPQQQHMPIEKRALWTWQRERASIASRWCWLQAQVQELDYKIRQHNELHKQVREQKGAVELEGSPVAYEGSLPGCDALDELDEPASQTCARVRPLRRETFKKRKLLQMHNLHIATEKAAKPSDIKCSCVAGAESCGVCSGRAESTQPAPAPPALPAAHARACVDPGYHPVLSDLKDVSPSVHMSAMCSRSWFRARATRPHTHTHAHAHGSTSRLAHAHAHANTHTNTHPDDHTYLQAQVTPKPVRRHPTRLKRGRPPLSRKIKERERDEETSTSGQERGRGRSSTETRWRRQSYDIDNIVIPQSVAANTRPQILTYKEIITPKWRVLDIPEAQMNNGVMKTSSNQNRMSIESEEEDVSEAAVAARHTRAETRERGRYLRKQRSRRSNHDANNDDENQQLLLNLRPPEPVPMAAPAQPPAPVPMLPMEHETVRPYTPRQFPLAEDAYMDMLSVMPDGYRACSSDLSPNTILTPPLLEEDDNSSTLSPMSPTAFDGDDPDDVEWDPSNEKAERRKSSFR